PADLIAFATRRPIGSKARRALSLLLYLGVRRGDLVKLVPKEPARHRQDPSASERVNKAAAAGARRDHRRKPLPERNVLGDFAGCGVRGAGLGNWFRDRCNEAGLPKCSADGLRKIAAPLCAEGRRHRAPVDGAVRLEDATAAFGLHARRAVRSWRRWLLVNLA